MVLKINREASLGHELFMNTCGMLLGHTGITCRKSTTSGIWYSKYYTTVGWAVTHQLVGAIPFCTHHNFTIIVQTSTPHLNSETAQSDTCPKGQPPYPSH